MFCDDLKRMLTSYANIGFYKKNITISESSSQSKVKNAIWVNGDFQKIDTTIAKDMTGFFQKAGSNNIFYLDCDGAFIIQDAEKTYFFLCELKSTFCPSDIFHARDQIVSTYIKLSMVLNLLPNYQPNNIIVKGFIISRPALKNYLRDLHKQSMVRNQKNDTDAQFCYNLCYNKSQTFTFNLSDCYKLKDFTFNSNSISKQIEIHHINVEEPKTDITIDVSQFI